MIVTELIGGIGNQLFQYAAGRQLAYLNHADLKVNISGFNDYNLRNYALEHFNITATVAAEADLAEVQTYEEKSFHVDPTFFSLPDRTMIKGYWQSEQYFLAIRDMLLTELAIKTPPSVANQRLINEIMAVNSISIHIRRGDYVSDMATFKVHGICELDYYLQCIHIIAQKVTNPHFFVFSDEPEWAIANLKTGFATTYVTHNSPEQHYEDLRLMSLCKHHIIANSSFSWWAAWLNTHTEKIVLAPQKWFRREVPDASDLIPESWLKI